MKMLELLDAVRGHPGFRDEKSLKRLHAFLAGYESAVGEFHIKDAAVFSDLRPFSEWVAKHYGWAESTAGWCNIILKESGGDDTLAIETFFTLFDTYREELAQDRSSSAK